MRAFAATLGALALWAAPAQAIVGGEPVPPGELRAVANVYVSGIFGCTGTLIAPKWVMTAAHCGSLTGVLTGGTVPSTFPYPPSQYTVYLDSVHADGRGGEEHAVTQVVVARDYGIQSGAGSDVALLELTSASKVPPIKIAAVGERSSWQPGVLATIAGFGLTEENGKAPDRMQRAQVPIQSDAYCREAYPNGDYDATTMLCAGYPQGGTDTCQGDSGGPLLVDVPAGVQRLVGATSFGEGCAQKGRPGVYARVAEGPLRAFVADVVPAALAPEPGQSGQPAQPGQQTGSGQQGEPRRRTARERRQAAKRRALAKCKTKRGRAAKQRCRALAKCKTRSTRKARAKCRTKAKRQARAAARRRQQRR